MRRSFAALSLILAAAYPLAAAWPTMAQTATATEGLTVPSSPAPGRNISATGKVMPPATGRGAPSEGLANPSLAADMVNAQKAAAAREKAWDSKMRKTMGSICSGC